MKKLKTLRITKSQADVLKAIMGIERLKYRGMSMTMRHKRHDKAIEQLKELRLIVLPEGSKVLELSPTTSRSKISEILIENNF